MTLTDNQTIKRTGPREELSQLRFTINHKMHPIYAQTKERCKCFCPCMLSRRILIIRNRQRFSFNLTCLEVFKLEPS